MGVETVGRRAVWGIAVSIIGIAFVILSSADSNDGQPSVVGDLLILASVVCWAFYTHLMRPVHAANRRNPDRDLVAHRRHDPGASLLALPAILRADWRAVAPLTWGAIFYSGVGSMGIAYLFWYRGVARDRLDPHGDVLEPAADRCARRVVAAARRTADAHAGNRRGRRARRTPAHAAACPRPNPRTANEGRAVRHRRHAALDERRRPARDGARAESEHRHDADPPTIGTTERPTGRSCARR